jgi:hypothetical protein
MTAIRRLVPVAAAALLAVPVVAGCAGASTGSTSTSSASPTSPEAATPTVSVTGTPATPSVDASQLSAIVTCLKNANLPTPTSTNLVGVAAELIRLARNPATAAALKACGVPVPGVSST